MKREKNFRRIAFFMLIVMIVTMIPTAVFAFDNRAFLKDEIKQASFDQENYTDAIYFDCSKSKVESHPDDYSVWHLVTVPKASCEKVKDMQVQFKDSSGNTDHFYNWHYTNQELSRNADGPDGWVIYTPGDYVIYTDPEESNNYIVIPNADPQFIISGYEQKVAPTIENGTVTLTNRDTEDHLISGASFKLVDPDGKPVSEQSAGSDGKIEWDGLSYGNYTLYETSAAPGYDLDSLTIDNIKIGQSGYGFSVNSDESVNITAYSTKSVVKQGTLILSMQDYDTGTPISGAAFELFDSNGKSLGGQSTGPDGTVSWSALTIGGKYTLYETGAAPDYQVGSLRIDDELIGSTGYAIIIGNDNEDGILNLTATNVKQETDDNGDNGGSDNQNGGSNDNQNGSGHDNGSDNQNSSISGNESGGKVLGDTSSPQHKVLGEETKTGDYMDILLVMLIAIAALAVFGIIVVKNADPNKKS